ncbi:hypothetical protein BD410DRAFT_317414 [Rickenella mellea]|uniref:Uncharacterized protein n=1 Tax=Rickenella mellea TaxID=50990 RepID=A0A4Y7PEU0_9AGAM|nr:hypothetical protein BD410DRAFT_317414 [Rickenella mellea]
MDSILNTVLCQTSVLERFSVVITGRWQPNEYPTNKTVTMGDAPSLTSLSITLNVRIADLRFSFFGGVFHNVRDLKLDWCTTNGDFFGDHTAMS